VKKATPQCVVVLNCEMLVPYLNEASIEFDGSGATVKWL